MGYHSRQPEERAHKPPSPSISPVYTLCKESDLPNHVAEMTTESWPDSTAFKDQAPEQDAPEQVEGSMYGVQNMDDGFGSSTSDSIAEDSDCLLPPDTPNLVVGKRRRNPVHPKILAAGQRIISSEHSSSSLLPKEPRVPGAVLTLQERLRSVSGDHGQVGSSRASTIPTPDFASSSTPRSGSPRSLRLSDEESITFDDSASQAVFSSSGEEDEEVRIKPEPISATSAAPGPQLIMPSLALPSRRPFTEQGSRMGSLRLLVTGQRGVGKSALIHELLDCCPDIVHSQTPRILRSMDGRDGVISPVMEISASTRTVPKWKMLAADQHSTSSLRAENVMLERNISILECDAHNVLELVEDQSRNALVVDSLNNTQLLELLTGESTRHVDILLYIIKGDCDVAEAVLIQRLSHITNVIPILIFRTSDEQRASVESTLIAAEARCVSLESGNQPLRISNDPRFLRLRTVANETNAPTKQNNHNSDGGDDIAGLASEIFHPMIMKKLRYTAVRKLIKWRESDMRSQPDLESSQNEIHTDSEQTPHLSMTEIPHMESSMTCSTISSPSGVLVPYSGSSFYQAESPALSAHTIDSTSRNHSDLQLAILDRHDRTPTSDIREVRLARWALDLQRSLQAEHEHHQRHWFRSVKTYEPPSTSAGAIVSYSESSGPSRMPSTKKSDSPKGVSRKSAVCNPEITDPLGIVGLGHRLRHKSLPVALRVAGIGAALATLALACMRSWGTIREFLPASWTAENGALPSTTTPSVTGFLDFGPVMPDASVLFGSPTTHAWDTFVGQLRSWITV
ncbi:hypothetical protein K461DRAFT_318509 [Myriangium duriaei CBS 260.36]|uniref:Septin-type G domain-containing protein n=1 Tax=Myriangium duriaei CBS 260.36 TaxID=1168546 RepID=A0A9P4JBJ8_9PEZI|nr:hypothetical protein K461DRAFT_318509 [Myriangium duriaei CBS 260.36]